MIQRDLSPLISRIPIPDSRWLIVPFVMMAVRPNASLTEAVDLNATAKIVPMWLELVPHTEMDRVYEYFLKVTLNRRSYPEHQTLANWQNLQKSWGHNRDVVVMAKALGLRDIIPFLSSGSDGDVHFYHSCIPLHGTLCAFWADSAGAVDRFLSNL